MNKVLKNLSIYMLILLIIIALLKYAQPQNVDVQRWRYDQFVDAVKQGQVQEVTIQAKETTNMITGQKKDGAKFKVVGLKNDDELTSMLLEKGVRTTTEESPSPGLWTNILTGVVPVLIFVLLFFFMMQQTQGGGNRVMSFGKSRARLHTDDKKKVTFADVAGADEVKEELVEVVDFLKNPKKFAELGARIPKGVLLFGSPGTGKTLLARAVAGEAAVPFFSISGSDFVEMFVGVGASRVRDLFDQGKKNAPCIIFIDEIDAVGRHRGAGLGGGHDEREQTLNQLLVEMDGFESSEGVILVSATNRPDVLDPALLRPGRFDRQVVVPLPDVRGREKILEVHTKKTPLAEDVDFAVISRGTPGFSGADIENLVNEAVLFAARFGKDKVTMSDFEFAKDKVLMGAERKSMVISDLEKKNTAYHESGHVLVARLLPGSDPIHKVTIIPRGMALGVTQQLPVDEKHTYPKQYLLDNITILLGGRAAEELILKDFTTGSGNDIERATNIARKMVCEWGMSDEMGPLSYGKKEEQIFLGREFATHKDYSEETAERIDKEISRIVSQCYEKAKQFLADHMHVLNSLAAALLEKEVLNSTEIDEIIGTASKKTCQENLPEIAVCDA